MTKHNNVLPNEHFKKKWQFNVRTWFNQPARKARRQAGAEMASSGIRSCLLSNVLSDVQQGCGHQHQTVLWCSSC